MGKHCPRKANARLIDTTVNADRASLQSYGLVRFAVWMVLYDGLVLAHQKHWQMRTNLTTLSLHNHNLKLDCEDYSKNLLHSVFYFPSYFVVLRGRSSSCRAYPGPRFSAPSLVAVIFSISGPKRQLRARSATTTPHHVSPASTFFAGDGIMLWRTKCSAPRCSRICSQATSDYMYINMHLTALKGGAAIALSSTTKQAIQH